MRITEPVTHHSTPPITIAPARPISWSSRLFALRALRVSSGGEHVRPCAARCEAALGMGQFYKPPQRSTKKIQRETQTVCWTMPSPPEGERNAEKNASFLPAQFKSSQHKHVHTGSYRSAKRFRGSVYVSPWMMLQTCILLVDLVTSPTYSECESICWLRICCLCVCMSCGHFSRKGSFGDTCCKAAPYIFGVMAQKGTTS